MGIDSAPFRELPPMILFYKVSHELEMETVYPKAVEERSRRIQLDGIPPPWLHPLKTSITCDMVPKQILEGLLATTILCFLDHRCPNASILSSRYPYYERGEGLSTTH